jgi:hypothetical protein
LAFSVNLFARIAKAPARRLADELLALPGVELNDISVLARLSALVRLTMFTTKQRWHSL